MATMHRVVRSSGSGGDGKGMGRFSVPFFFEPGEACVVEAVGREGWFFVFGLGEKKGGGWLSIGMMMLKWRVLVVLGWRSRRIES